VKLPGGVGGAPVVLVRGSDPPLVRSAVEEVVAAVVGGADPMLAVEDLGAEALLGEGAGDPDLSVVVAAAGVPAFLADRRVVVARGLGVVTTAEGVAPLVAYLEDPLPSSTVVLVWDKPPESVSTKRVGPPPKALVGAVEAAGGVVVDTAPPKGAKPASAWFGEQVGAAGVRLDPPATRRLEEFLGEDVGGLPGVLRTLEGVFGSGARLGVADIEPFLVGEGGVPPWDLTDAIDAGDVAGSLEALGRLLGPGGRHPLAVLAILDGHVGAMASLDGAGVSGRDEAARVAGVAPFRAGKALTQGSRLGSERLGEFTQLLATADVDLRGGSAAADRAVLEVLVARLASRSRVGRGARR